MNKFEEKYIGLVCQNEHVIQEIFSTIFYNLNGTKNNVDYHFITFNNIRNFKYHYIIYINDLEFLNINNLRFYLTKNKPICIVNKDSGDADAFSNFDNIITYSVEEKADIYINNISINSSIITCNIHINDYTKEIYFKTNNQELLSYYIPIIILLLNEQYSFESIKNIIQKVGI